MPVYEDGTIDCWKRVALSDLSGELKSGWLVTEIPVGKSISIHGLGEYEILSAKWEHTPKSFLKSVNHVQSMNSEMAGLFSETAEQKQRWKENKVCWSADGTP